VLWIAGSEKWSINTGGTAVLYGANDHANTMLTLNPGEWVRVIGKGNLRLLNDEVVKLSKSGHPADHVYAETHLYREETLTTATLAATSGREVCLAQVMGQSAPIYLSIP
jgi:hypothetical protein